MENRCNNCSFYYDNVCNHYAEPSTTGYDNKCRWFEEKKTKVEKITLNEIIRTTHYGDEVYYRASDVDAEIERLHKYERFEEDRNRLVEVVKLFYRKHVLNDESIGWDELGNNLYNELAETLGDKEFCKWLDTQSMSK